MTLRPDRLDESFLAPDRPDESRDRAWVEAIRTGDASAFTAMFRTYVGPLCTFAFRYLNSREEAQELVQDVFLWIWDRRHEWAVSGTLRAYLFTATRNRALNHRRHAAIEARFRERAGGQIVDTTRGQPAAAADQEAHVGELAAVIERVIQELPPRCREVFELSRRQQLSYAEIAELLQISTRTVEVHMGRALVALRRALADWQ